MPTRLESSFTGPCTLHDARRATTERSLLRTLAAHCTGTAEGGCTVASRGVYSVPSFGCVGCGPAEWYWHSLRGGADPVVNGKRVPCCGLQTNPQVVAYHEKMYNNMSYTSFGPMFTAEFFQPDEWAALFKKAGIKYVVLTSKHHEGWTNWCSAEAFGWNSCDNGAKRDLVGDLTSAVKSAGLRMGLYLSMYEWYHPLYVEDAANNFTTSRYVDEVYWPQAKEINIKYKPDLLWSDGDVGDSSWWRSAELLAWLYNEAPNKDTIVVNDRWGTCETSCCSVPRSACGSS